LSSPQFGCALPLGRAWGVTTDHGSREREGYTTGVSEECESVETNQFAAILLRSGVDFKNGKRDRELHHARAWCTVAPMNVHIRADEPRDREAVLAFAARFAEFAVPEWRTAAEIAEGTQRFLARQLDALGADEAVFVAEDDGGQPLGFVYVRTDRDFFT